MKYLVFFALIAAAAAKPMPGYLSGLDLGDHGLGYASSYGDEYAHAAPVIQTAQVVHAAPVIQAAQVVHAAPVIQAAPVIHAPIVAKAQATSYSSFNRVIHPVAQKIIQTAPVVHAAPIIHAAPVIQSAPLLSVQSHGLSYGHSLGGHGW